MKNKPGSARPIAPRKAVTLSLAAAVSAVLAGHSALATSDTWDGSTNALWSNSTNWLLNPVTVPGLGDVATFSLSAGAVNSNTTIDLGGNVTVGSILFDTAAAAAYTIGTGAAGSQTLTLGDAGSITMNSTVANNEMVNAGLLLGTSATAQTFTLTNQSATNSLTVAGGINGFGGAGARTLAVAGAGNTVLAGAMGNGGGTVAVTKSGGGALTLSGLGTYTGGLTLSGGTLNFNNSAAAGNTIPTRPFDSTARAMPAQAITIHQRRAAVAGSSLSESR